MIQSGQKKMRIAVVGLGGIGNNHSKCYLKNPNVELVAVCDLLKDRAEAAAKAYSVPAFLSVADLLAADLKLDGASVCTAGKENGGDHYEPTMQLLRAGVPVLGEKPISNELAKAREMVACAKELNVRYGVNLNHRFTPAAKRAKEWVAAGRLGEMNIINMMMWINNPNETSPHFHIRALHPHSFDVMRFFGGDVEAVHAFFKRGHQRQCWSNVHVNLLFKNGVIGHLTGSYDAGGGASHHWGLERCEIVGHDARIIIGNACESLEFQPRRTSEAERYDYLGNMKAWNETFQTRIDAWVDDLIKQTPCDQVNAKGEDALKAQHIIEAAIESWEKRSVVTL